MKILQRAVQSALGQMGQSCPPGQVMTGYGCRATTVAAAGRGPGTPSDLTTVSTTQQSVCPPGQIMFNGQCSTLTATAAPSVIKPVCPPGQIMFNGQCISVSAPSGGGTILQCPPGSFIGPDGVTCIAVSVQRDGGGYVPPGSGATVLATQPSPCCPGPCRLIAWNDWQAGFHRRSPI